jgi:hypothetical protein
MSAYGIRKKKTEEERTHQNRGERSIRKATEEGGRGRPRQKKGDNVGDDAGIAKARRGEGNMDDEREAEGTEGIGVYSAVTFWLSYVFNQVIDSRLRPNGYFP